LDAGWRGAGETAGADGTEGAGAGVAGGRKDGRQEDEAGAGAGGLSELDGIVGGGAYGAEAARMAAGGEMQAGTQGVGEADIARDEERYAGAAAERGEAGAELPASGVGPGAQHDAEQAWPVGGHGAYGRFGIGEAVVGEQP
jgi:hypothetical protein